MSFFQPLIVLAVLMTSLMPSFAQACQYDAQQAATAFDRAIFVGKVKILSVSYALKKTLTRPEVTYQIIEAYKKPDDLKSSVFKTPAGVVSSCDYTNNWAIGDTVDEAFYNDEGTIRASNVNEHFAVTTDERFKPAKTK